MPARSRTRHFTPRVSSNYILKVVVQDTYYAPSLQKRPAQTGESVAKVVWQADGGLAEVSAFSPGCPHWAPKEGTLGNGTALDLGGPVRGAPPAWPQP